MVREGIVLGHKILEKGIEVDKVKIDVTEQVLPLTNVKGIHNFLGHPGFYRIHLEFLLDCSTPHASSCQRCPVRLHRRVPSIIQHFEEGTRFYTYYIAS
jgi:hypothetical protein